MRPVRPSGNEKSAVIVRSTPGDLSLAVAAVTVDDVRRVARAYFHPDALCRVIVGPE